MRALCSSAMIACLLSVIAFAIDSQRKTAGIRKVAVLSVTGPARLDGVGAPGASLGGHGASLGGHGASLGGHGASLGAPGAALGAPLQDAIDHAESALVQGLGAKGVSVVALADSKAFADANWEAAYSNSIRDSRSLAQTTSRSASRNTLVLRDMLPGERPASAATYSSAFRRTAGELARRMGADGAVLFSMSPGLHPHSIQQVIQMLFIDQNGETIFRDEVRCESEVRNRQLSAAINHATDEGIRIALEHYALEHYSVK